MAFDVLSLSKYALYPIKWIARLFARPELDIEISGRSGLRGATGEFHDHTQFHDGLCLVPGEQLIQRWNLQWSFTMTISNNSESTANRIHLVLPAASHYLMIRPEISYGKSLKSGDHVVHQMTFRESMVGTSLEATTRFNDFPFEAMELRYRNFTKVLEFYTRYQHNDIKEKRNEYGTI